jgi:hypothetical protein
MGLAAQGVLARVFCVQVINRGSFVVFQAVGVLVDGCTSLTVVVVLSLSVSTGG